MSIRAEPSTQLLERARRLYGRGAFADALEVLARVPSEGTSERDFHLLQGACFARTRQRDAAIVAFSELLVLDPDCHEALTWMALLTRDPADMSEAIGYARRAVELRPEDATGHGSLGTCYLSANLAAPAIESFSRAVGLAPDVAEHRHNLALALLMAHRQGEAIVQLRRAMALAPESPQSYLTLASTYGLYGMAGPAIECLSDGLSKMPNNASLHSAIAGAFSMIRNDAAAERHHRRALELSPESRSGFASWLLNQGRFEDANEVFGQMLKDNSDPAFAYYGLMQSRNSSVTVEAMSSLLVSGNLRPRSEMYLRYALGRAEEQRKDFESAMMHFDAANRLAFSIYHAGNPVDPASFREEHLSVQRLYESMRESAPPANLTPAPIFIIGMIRSGTTLLDQIVSSHPAVASGGELRFWIEETLRLVAQGSSSHDLLALSEEYVNYAQLLAGKGERVTDKMPLNFAYAGIINLALPNARLLHIRRNPVDTCLSIYTTFFGQGALFAYNKRNVVEYYREYLAAMDYWRAELPPNRLLEIDYEELIADPVSVIPKVIEFCGLPWDEACLNHHQNESAINTPSRWQARQPIYKSSLERWRNYEPWLGEFAQLLTP